MLETIHYGPPLHDDVDESNETTEESDRASDATLARNDVPPEVLQMMRDTNTAAQENSPVGT